MSIEENDKELLSATEDRLESLFGNGEDVEDDYDEDDELDDDSDGDDSDDEDDSTPNDEEDDDSADEDDEDDDSTPDDDDESSNKDDSDEDDSDEDDSDEDDSDEDGSNDNSDDNDENTGGLPDAYCRAAIHRGWTQEDVDKFYKADPELAVKTLGGIYDAVNKSTRDFAEIGRARKLLAEAETKAKQQSVKQTEHVDNEPEIDFKKLKKEYPEDPLIDAMELMYNKIQKVRPAETQEQQVQTQQPVQQEAQYQLEAAIRQQVDAFFEGVEKDYSDSYGRVSDSKQWDENMTIGQKSNRWAVLEMADQLIIGSKASGKEMPLDEALMLAHMSTTESEREKVIRKKIKKQVTKRSKGISLKPTSSARKETTGKPKSKQDLLSRTEGRLSKIFG